MNSRVLGETQVWGCPSSKNEKPESEERSRALKMLTLYGCPKYNSVRILRALESNDYNAICCHNMDLNEGDFGEPPPEYRESLKALIHSRKWLRLEFHTCVGLEYLFCPEANDEEELRQTTEVDTLLLKLPLQCGMGVCSCYNKERHPNFFASLWKYWKVRKLNLSMNFNPEWTKEFCRREVSLVEDLEINPECRFHRYDDKGSQSENDGNETTNGTDDVKDIDCWKLFCRELRENHPHLTSLAIYCKTSDNDLAYLIDHAIAPANLTDSDSKTASAVLPIEHLYFSKLCKCDDQSLYALSRVLNSSSAQKWRSLTISRGVKLPSRASLDEGLPLPPRPLFRHGLLEFCRSLRYAPALTKLSMGDFIFDEFEMGALFESLVLASGRIEKLSLFDSAATSNDVYEKVLCGGAIGNISQESPSSLIQNRLPNLRFLRFPREALKALVEVLKYNTSIESINHTWRTQTHEYYLDLNRGGRRILTNSAGTKDGSLKASPTLWPTILERASSNLHTSFEKNRYCGGEKRKYDVVYHLLRNKILVEL